MVLAVTGDVDLYTVPRLTAALELAVRERPPVLVVDLTGVEFFGSVGLNALLAAHDQAAAHTEIRVVAARRVALSPIQLTGVDRLLAVYPSRAAALA
jgi:anti-anti-sigma factor